MSKLPQEFTYLEDRISQNGGHVLIKSGEDLIKYNNLSNEALNDLPQGYAIQTPKTIQTIKGEHGNIKLFENFDDTATIIFPDVDGTSNRLTFNDDNDLLIYGDKTNPDKITFTDDNGFLNTWDKDNNGNFFQSELSNDDFVISYISNDDIVNASSVTILNDNVDLSSLANQTNFTVDDLSDFNRLNTNTLKTNDVIEIPKSVNKYTHDDGSETLTLMKGHDGSIVHFVPDEHGNRQKVVTGADGSIVSDSFDSNESEFTAEEKAQTGVLAQEEMASYIKENGTQIENTNEDEESAFKIEAKEGKLVVEISGETYEITKAQFVGAIASGIKSGVRMGVLMKNPNMSQEEISAMDFSFDTLIDIANYLKNTGASDGSKLNSSTVVAGHSLGGSLTQVVAYELGVA